LHVDRGVVRRGRIGRTDLNRSRQPNGVRTTRRAAFRLLGSLLTVIAGMAAAAAASDDELARHLATIRSQIEDLTKPLERREDLALETADTLDRAAQATSDAEIRRTRWSQAVELCDWFLKEFPDSPRQRQLRFRAGLYSWAMARSYTESWQLDPRDPRPRGLAVAALDQAIDRFRSIGRLPEIDKILADNLRFRLAESLADRALWEPTGSDQRTSRESEALALLAQPPAEPELAGYWHLLKADLLLRAGKPGLAEPELSAATKAKPPPPETEVLEVRVPLFLAQQQFAESVKVIDGSHLPAPQKNLWTLRIRLAERAGRSDPKERFAAESELFRIVKELCQTNGSESRLALLELAKAGVTPDPKEPPEAWESLATAYATAGDLARAGSLMLEAAAKAKALGRSALAGSFRLRAGAFYFQAGRFADVDTVLEPLESGPAAGKLGAQAGMLRCLALERALAAGLPGISIETYTRALDRQIRDFPSEPATQEARWLRGQIAQAANRAREARALWSAIPSGSPRWLDSRLAIAALDRDELEAAQINPDRDRLRALFEHSDRFLQESQNQAQSDPDLAAILLASARLELTPLVGKADSARERCERVLQLALASSLHYQARLTRIAALVELARYVAAEREAQSHYTSWRVPAQWDTLIDAIRLLDQHAASADTDLKQRRYGLVLRLLILPFLNDKDNAPPNDRNELAMRWTRALLFAGDDLDARRSLSNWGGVPSTKSDRMLRDLGDTYRRLEMYPLDIDVERLRMKNNPTGSLLWFDARYALAVAYFRSGKLREAAQLIDSAEILHPDLGGGVLREKFIHLRQRLGSSH
jgi:hypothetical protein